MTGAALLFNGHRPSAWEHENVLETVVVVVTPQCEMYLMTLNCPLKMAKMVNYMSCIVYYKKDSIYGHVSEIAKST